VHSTVQLTARNTTTPYTNPTVGLIVHVSCI